MDVWSSAFWRHGYIYLSNEKQKKVNFKQSNSQRIDAIH